jgi:transcription-repair coupling factor (superfamily II helicase)
MYMSLLDQTVKELQGQQPKLEVKTAINLGLDLRIPSDYIADEHQRLRAYKRIADAADEARAREIVEELADRYGPSPEPVQLLVRFALIKSAAETLGISAIDRKQGRLNLKFHPESQVDPQRLTDWLSRSPQVQFTPDGVLRLPAVEARTGALLDQLEQCLGELSDNRKDLESNVVP